MTAATPTVRRPRARWLTFSNVVCALVLLCSSPVLWWAIVDRQPIASNVSELMAKNVRQGDYLQISYKITWNARCRVTAFRYIIDQMQVEWPVTEQSRIVEPGYSEFVIRVPIPLAAAPGEAIYRADIEYNCNPYQQLFPLRQKLTPRHFVIDPGPEAATGLRQGMNSLEGAPLVRLATLP